MGGPEGSRAGVMSEETSEGFLGRWSRNKRAAEKAVAEPVPEAEALPPSPPQAEPETPQISQEELDALPRIEDLVEGSDIRAFLRPGVPSQLRNAALRRMWMLTPAIRDYSDPAVDYAWDWNTPGGVPGDGVGPSAEKAAAMLKDMLNPRQPRPPEAAAKLEEVSSEEPAEPSQTESSEPPQPKVATAPEAHTDGDIEPEPEMIQRRRHGSALPS